jgi:hypothetical protein
MVPNKSQRFNALLSSQLKFETSSLEQPLSNSMEEETKPPLRRFGLGRDARKPSEPLNMTENTTVWEIYNYESGKIDREMIKDWNDSLNTLLIFVSRHSNSVIPVAASN